MSRYSKGAYLERLVRRRLEQAGYTVIRSAGSKGPVDLIAGDGSKVFVIQCRSRTSLRPRERTSLERAAQAFGARPMVVYRKNRREIAVEPEGCISLGYRRGADQ